MKDKTVRTKGFTLVELMVATVISAIVLIGIGSVLASSQRDWNNMYNRMYSDVVVDSHIARKAFDAVVRRASGEVVLLEADGSWLEVYHYADANSADVDRYARFYTASNELKIEYGTLDDPRQVLSTQAVCSNVTSCVFKSVGRSAQMTITLDNGSETSTVICSTVMHN